MKNTYVTSLTLLLFTLTAQAQTNSGNGGSVLENESRTILVNIRDWIKSENYLSMKGPAPRADYASKMLSVLENLPLTTFLSKEQYEARFSDGKDCHNFPEQNPPEIVCNQDTFPNDIEKRYRILHHEVAGLAGIENNNGDPRSNYIYSDQVSGELKFEIIKRLPIREKSDVKSLYCYRLNHRFGVERIFYSQVDFKSKTVTFRIGVLIELLENPFWKIFHRKMVREYKKEVANGTYNFLNGITELEQTVPMAANFDFSQQPEVYFTDHQSYLYTVKFFITPPGVSKNGLDGLAILNRPIYHRRSKTAVQYEDNDIQLHCTWGN